MFNMGPFSDKHTAATIPASIQREWLTSLLMLRSEEAAPIDWVLRLQSRPPTGAAGNFGCLGPDSV